MQVDPYHDYFIVVTEHSLHLSVHSVQNVCETRMFIFACIDAIRVCVYCVWALICRSHLLVLL